MLASRAREFEAKPKKPAKGGNAIESPKERRGRTYRIALRSLWRFREIGHPAMKFH
jgi:hypothetical protein